MSIEEIAESLQAKNYNKIRGDEQYKKIKLMRNKVLQESFMYGEKRKQSEKIATIGGVDYSMWVSKISMNALWYYLSRAIKRHIILIDKNDTEKSQIRTLREEIDNTTKQVLIIEKESIKEILQMAKSIATRGEVIMFISEDENLKAEYKEEVLRL